MRVPLVQSASGDLDAVRAGWAEERARLLRRRLPLVLALWAFWIGAVLLCERAWFPARAVVMLRFYVQDWGVCAVALLLLAWRRTAAWSRTIAAATCAWLVVRTSWYAATTALPAELLTLAVPVVLGQLPAVLPWGAGAQAAVVGVGATAALVVLPGLPHGSPIAYLALALGSAAVTSIFAAGVLDANRWTAYRRTQREADERRIAAALVRVGETLSAALARPDLLRQVNALASRLLDADWCGTWVLDAAAGRPVLAASDGATAADVAALPLPADAARRWWPVGRDPVEVADVAGEPHLPAALHERVGLASALLVPIVQESAVVGVLIAGTRHAREHVSPAHRRLAVGIAHATAIALANVRRLEALEAASRLKSEFVSTVSHEFRTPLNVIGGYAELLEDDAFGPLTPEQREPVVRLRRSTRELRELVDATLAVGRLEAGREVVRRDAVDLGALCAELRDELAPVVPTGVRLGWQVPAPGGVVVTDATKLKTIVRNLVGNAMKFTPAGLVEVVVLVGDDELRLIVRDTGIGIAVEDRSAIFEMFRQLDASPTRRHGGVGLGLHIVARLVGLLGGRIGVESAPGRGSVFTVSLPIGAAEEAADAAAR